MLLTVCSFADDARKAADGKLTIVGVHNGVAVQSLPARLSLKLVMRFVAEPQDDKVPQQVTLRLKRPDGTEMTDIRADPFTFDVPPDAPVDLDQVLDLTVQVETPGRHQFEVEINGVPTARTPLLVLERPDLVTRGRKR
jgi:sporulation-control protein spo0M